MRGQEAIAAWKARDAHDDAMARVLGYRSYMHMIEERAFQRITGIVAPIWKNLSIAERTAIKAAFELGYIHRMETAMVDTNPTSANV